MHQHAGQTDTDTLTRPLALEEDSLYLCIQEFTVTHSSQGPTLLSLSSSSLFSHSVSLRSCWMCFIHFLFFLLRSATVFIIYFALWCYFYLSPCLSMSSFPLEVQSWYFCPTVAPSLSQSVFFCAECRLCLGRQDLVLLSHPCLFLLSVPTCRVCLSASVLMDLSLVDLQHSLQL